MADHDEEAGLIPILVDGSGRDGTTLAMQLLATAPEIAFDRVYPYEQRYFNYLLQWSRLPEQGGRAGQLHPVEVHRSGGTGRGRPVDSAGLRPS